MFIQTSQAIVEVRNPVLTNERSQRLCYARHLTATDTLTHSKSSYKSVLWPLSV